ncbi:TonB-dependent receptor domain-containing protein [Thalassospira marina]|uniref:TonB-dependent heme/hemoglobin receptor family protein n=1 Tax=Thalassospira marina TaxID=2048283 RepID=A0ABM6Q555_9PROT|nr:TonB-dependent receptor [Thalassospira marina]AUG51643.1 TonB-dependent heme/hemoglobin receptor family protein [Thalassospira marina]
MTSPLPSGSSFKWVLLLGTALIPAVSVSAFAQQKPVLAADSALQFNIPRTDLVSAIDLLSQQVDRTVALGDGVNGSQQVGPLVGRYSLDQALSRLLGQSGMGYQLGNGSIIVLPAKPAGRVLSNQPGEVQKLDPVIVVADHINRFNAGVSSVDSKLIERTQATTVPELMDDLPAVDMNGTARPQGQSLNIWGFGDQEDVKILLDGAQKDFEKYRQGTVFIEPELVKRIDVHKGAFSPRSYGAFGGTVELTTKSAADMLRDGQDFGAFTKFGYATNGNENTETTAVYGRDQDAGIQLLVSGTRRDNNKFRTSDGQRLNLSSGTLYSGHFKGSIDRNDHFIEIAGAMSQSDRLAPFAAKRGQIIPSDYLIGVHGYDLALARSTVDRETSDRSLSGEYNYNPDSDLINTTAKVSWSRTSQRDARLIQDMFVSLGLGGNMNWLTYDTYTADLYNQSDYSLFGLDNSFTYGVQYKFQDRDSWAYDYSQRNSASGNYGHLQPYNIPSGDQATYSGWGEYNIDFGNGFELTPGLRYDYVVTRGVANAASKYNNPAVGHDYGEERYSGFSPSVNAFYQINPNYSLFGDWAYKLRAPLVDEIYTVGSTRATSNQLTVERVNSKRIGFATRFENVLQESDVTHTRLSLFRNDVDDNIQVLFGSPNVALYGDNAPSYANLTGYYTQGIEAEFYYDSPNVFGGATYSLMEGQHNGSLRDINGADQPVYDVAPMKLVTTLGYKVAAYDLSLGWKGKFVKRKTDIPDDDVFPYSPYPASAGYALHDLFVSWTPDDGAFAGAEANFTVQNLFDKNYVPYLGVFPGKGRNFKFSLSYKL